MSAAARAEKTQSALETLKALPRLAAEEQREAFERLIRDPSPAIRESAVRIGASILNDDAVVSYLRNDADDVLRSAGLEMLKRKGPAAIDLAVRLLEDRDPDVVLQAVLLLDHLGDPRALEPMRAVLSHPNPNVQQAAILAVGTMGHHGVVGELLEFLGAGLWLQMAAIEALGKLRATAAIEPLAALLPDPSLGPLAADALTRIGGERAFACLAGHWMAEGGLDTKRLELLAYVLEGTTGDVQRPDDVIAALTRALDSSDRAGRTAAARCLLVLGPGPEDARAIEVLAAGWGDSTSMPAGMRLRPDLMETLLTGNGVQRGWGFRLAAEYPYRVPATALAAALDATHERQHFTAVAEALYAIADPDLGGLVVRLYGRLPAEVRIGWGPLLRRYAPAVREAVESDPDLDPGVRQVLAAAFEVGSAAVATAVAQLPREERVEALAHIADRRDVLHRLPWTEWLSEAPEIYGSYAVQTAEQAGLENQLWAVRKLLLSKPHRELIRLVGALADRESVPLLEKLVDAGSVTLKPFALAALGKIGGPDARRVLRRHCQWTGRWVRFAYRALAECRTIEDLDLFRLGTEHEDWHVRMVCASVLHADGDETDQPLLALLSADTVSAVSDRAKGLRAQ